MHTFCVCSCSPCIQIWGVPCSLALAICHTCSAFCVLEWTLLLFISSLKVIQPSCPAGMLCFSFTMGATKQIPQHVEICCLEACNVAVHLDHSSQGHRLWSPGLWRQGWLQLSHLQQVLPYLWIARLIRVFPLGSCSSSMFLWLKKKYI